jgi:hypothetical protein
MEEFENDEAMKDIGYVQYKSSKIGSQLEKFTECLRNRT